MSVSISLSSLITGWILLLVANAIPHNPESPLDNFQLSCANNFILYNENCYRYFGYKTKRPFHHAQKMCSRHCSSLVSLQTLEEEIFVVQLAENNSAFWIGLSDEDQPSTAGNKEGVFRWTSGEELHAYYNWKEGEPYNREHLDCVKADHSGWSVAKGGCATSRLPFVCKKKACPVGYEWGGASCDVITKQETDTPTLPPSNSSSLVVLYGTAIMSMLIVVVVCVLVYTTTAARTRTSSRLELTQNTQPDHIEHRRFRDRVEDLYPT